MCQDTDPDHFPPSSKRLCKKCVPQDPNYIEVRKIAQKRYRDKIRASRPERLKKHYELCGQSNDRNIIRHRWASARNRNKEFTLTLEEAQAQYDKQNGKCYYSGLDMPLKRGDRNNTISLDRKDNEKGYTANNIVWCLGACNTMKSALKVEDWLALMKTILDYQNYR